MSVRTWYTTPSGHAYEEPSDISSLRQRSTDAAQGDIEHWDPLEKPPRPTWGMVGLALQTLDEIVHMHRKTTASGGMTSGFCAECSWRWPCPTWHKAQGFDHHKCEDERWCEHVGQPL